MLYNKTRGLIHIPSIITIINAGPLDADQWSHGDIQIILLTHVSVHASAVCNRFLIDRCFLSGAVCGGPDVVADCFFLPAMLHDDVANCLLEVERTQFHLRVEKTVDEDTGVKVLLGVNAEILVLRHDSLVHVADQVESLVGGILVAVDLVAHYTLSWAGRGEALHEEEVGTGKEKVSYALQM